jgi:hypothetical protein
MDRLYLEYNRDRYADVPVDPATDPELVNFIESINSGVKKFNDYPVDELEYFAERIYELRKNNTDNPA